VGKREPRMTISTEGMESSGKTDFALSAPRPMTYLDFDYGVEGVARAEPEVHKQYDLASAEWLPEAQAKRHVADVMRGFVADFRKAIADKTRTLVVDTFTRAWSAQRLARSEDKYADIEEEFLSLVAMAHMSPHTNLILIHHMRQDWKRTVEGKSYKVDTWSRDGMDNILTKVQLGIRQRYIQPIPEQRAGALVVKAAVSGRFEIDVLKARDNIGLVGATLPGMTFAELCGIVAPAIDWSK
jgi:hypothetical protein